MLCLLRHATQGLVGTHHRHLLDKYLFNIHRHVSNLQQPLACNVVPFPESLKNFKLKDRSAAF